MTALSGPALYRTEGGPAPLGVTLQEPAGVARADEPVSFSVPFAKGHVADPAAVSLRTERGEAMRADRRVLALWPDGSVRWLQLTFAATLGANERMELIVTTGDEAPVATPTSGPALAPLWDGRLSTELAFVAVDAEGTQYHASAPELSVVHESPSRVLTRLDAELRSEAGGRFGRIAAWLDEVAGCELRRLVITYIGDEDVPFQTIRDLRLELPAPRVKTWAFGADSGTQAHTGTSLPASLIQYHHSGYRVGEGGAETRATGKRAAGWVDVSGPEGGLTVALRYPWQNFPTAWEVRRDGDQDRIVLHLYAPETEAGPLTIIQGTAKTFQLLLWPHEPNADPSQAAAASAEPLLPVVDPAYVHATRALREIGSYDPLLLRRYEDRIGRSLTGFIANREATEAYGFKSFGDGIHVGRGATDPHCLWISLQYDPAQGALLHYARTGDRRFFELGEQCGWHSADIDTIHCGEQLGGSRWYAPQDHNTNAVYSGHVVVEGMITLYWLTGQPRLLEVAREVGQWPLNWARHVDAALTYSGMERELGWPLIGQNAVYEATLDPVHLDAARAFVGLASRWQDPVRGVWTCVVGEEPKWYGGASFTGGLLLEGIARYFELTGDEAARRSFLRGMEWMTAEMYRPDLGFWYKQAPAFAASNDGGGMSTLVIPNYTFTHRLTGNRTWLDIGLEVFAQQTMIGDVLKMFGFGTRAMPRFVGDAVEAFDRLLPRIVTSTGSPASIFVRKDAESVRLRLRPERGEGRFRMALFPNGFAGRSLSATPDVPGLITLDGTSPQGTYEIELSSAEQTHWVIERDLEDWARRPLALWMGDGMTLIAPAREDGQRIYDLLLMATPQHAFPLSITPLKPGQAVSATLLDGRGRIVARGSAQGGDILELEVSPQTAASGRLCNLVAVSTGPVRIRVGGTVQTASLTGAGWFEPGGSVASSAVVTPSDLVVPPPPRPQVANLLSNPGFEEPLGEDKNPPAWRFIPSGDDPRIGFALDTEQRAEGGRSLRIHFPETTGVWRMEHSAPIPAGPGERYRLEATMRRGLIRDQSGSDRCDVHVHACDAQGQVIRHNVGIVYSYSEQWRTDTHEFTTPPGTASLKVELADYGYYMFLGTELWFDDIRLYRVPDVEASKRFDLEDLARRFETVELAPGYARSVGIWWETGSWTSTDEPAAHSVEIDFRADKLLDGLEIAWPAAPQQVHLELRRAGDETWYAWPHSVRADERGAESWGLPVKACALRITVLPGDGPPEEPDQLAVTNIRLHQTLPR